MYGYTGGDVYALPAATELWIAPDGSVIYAMTTADRAKCAHHV